MNTIRLIETYLENKLEGKELEDFLDRLEKDNLFKEEVELHREVNESILDDCPELRTQIKGLMPGKKHSISRVIGIFSALAAIFIIGMTIFSITSHPRTDKAFENFYQPYETDLTTRSNDKIESDLKYAYVSYQNKDYKTSFELLKNQDGSVECNCTAMFYLGLSALELNKFTVAETSLQKVSTNSNSYYSLHADWYLSMLYLKYNQPTEAKGYLEQLANSNNFYTRKAKKILKKYL